MYPALKFDLDNLAEITKSTAELANHYLHTLNERPASQEPRSFPTLDIPITGEGAQKALSLFTERYFDGLTASSGPRSFGYVVGGATPAAIMGDWLTSAFDQDNGEGVTIHLENEAVQLMRQLFGLSDKYFGSFVSGATMSNFVGLAIARQWAAHQQGIDIAKTGLYHIAPIKVLSGKPHASIYKALSMLGMGRDSLVELPCLPNTESVDVQALERNLQQLGGTPCIVVANAGTVNTTSFDNFVDIGHLKKEYSFWLHVDAAFGMFAACSPRLSPLVQGHQPSRFHCRGCPQMVKRSLRLRHTVYKAPQLQRQVFQNTNAAYLGKLTGMVDYMNHI